LGGRFHTVNLIVPLKKNEEVLGVGGEEFGANVPERLEVVNVVRLFPIGKIACATRQKFGF
jgi:hypothetical protein